MRKLILIALLLTYGVKQTVLAQSLSFAQLNTSNGLSDNYVQCLVIDKNGYLWVGTPDGLNKYDGYTISSWFKSSQSGLPSDTIRQLYCDSKNRIWAATPGSVAWSDEEKRFHNLQLPDKKERYGCFAVYETTKHGIVLFTTYGHYLFNEQTKQLEKVDWLSSLIDSKGINIAVPFSKEKIIYVYEEKVVVVDYNKREKVFEKEMVNAVTACRYNDQCFAVASRNGKVSVFNINDQKEVSTYNIFIETAGKRSSPRVTEMVKASDGSLAIATILGGLYMIDSVSGKTTIYTHDPLDAASVSANVLFRVFAGRNGELITGSQSTGVSISNINNKTSVNKRAFKDAHGNVFDGHINVIAEDQQGFLWISAIDRLIRWDKKTNIAEFYFYFFDDPFYGPRNLEIRTICIDRKNRIWVGAIGAGVALFNRQSGTFRLITKDTTLGQEVTNNYVNELIEDGDGKIWACTFGGFYRIDPENFKITIFHDHPVLKEAAQKIVISLFEDSSRRMWIGTQRFGIYCYDPGKNELRNYTTKNGLLTNNANSIVADKYGNIYSAHLNGFSVIAANGTIKTFSKANGLHYARCESILPDDNGFAWIGNNKGIVRYDPITGKLEYFEANAGISSDGFRFDAVCKTRDGILYFGTNRGINYFDPLQIKNYTAQLRVNIYQVSLPNSIIRFDSSGILRAKHTENSVQFHFTAVNLTGSHNIAYEYMLEEYDKEWQKGIDVHEARYPSLPAGKYKFIVKASIDKINWTTASNEVNIEIIPPFWKRWWFVLASSVLLIVFIIAIIQLRINRIRYSERLKTVYNKKISETEMKALRAQMNPHFIFNSLNSINKYILKNDHTNASRYLTRFAKLIRLILDNSNSKEVPLSSELEALKLYIEMESLRFTNKFSYEILVDDNVSPDTLQVPPLIIQPYVENAIWHGLLHKESGGKLSIHVTKTSDNMLQCIIEDNGIGRIKANELKSKSATANKSLGMKLTEERIAMLNKYTSLNASIHIVDLEDDRKEPAGTKVILTIPI